MLAMRAAYEAASVSPDRSTQNGAVILGDSNEPAISACNKFPRGVDPNDDAAHEKPLKYKLIMHAERRAIFKAAALGFKTGGRTMVCPWAPCPECAQAILGSCITRLVLHKDRYDETPGRWKVDVDLGLKMLEDAGVEVAWIEGPVDAGVAIRFDGREIQV